MGLPSDGREKGRGKKCSQRMTVPRAEELASMSAMPALELAGVGSGGGEKSIDGWIRAGISQVGLAAITIDRMPLHPTRPSALDDGEDSNPTF
jgi:hypothetical protein